MTPQQRQIVELILDDLTIEQIGDLLGKTPDAVARAISNIRRRLRDKQRAIQNLQRGTRNGEDR